MTRNSVTPVDDSSINTLDIRSSASIQPLSKRICATKPKIRQSERQKREKEALRKELVVLQKILDQIQPTDPKMTTKAQKAFVQRRLNNRLMAEMHQNWLRTAVTGKTALINDLITLVHQYLRTASVLTMQSQGLYDGVILQPSDELLYAMYIYELDGIYAQTNEVFQSCGMDPAEETTSFQQTTVTTMNEVVSMQYGWKQFFPFNFKPTCDSMWMLAHLLNRQEARESCDDVKDPQNTVAVKFRVTRSKKNGEREALNHRFVHRRFVENDREVTVWKASIVGDGAYRGMQMEETGWCVYRLTRGGTIGQVCIRQVPLHLRSAVEVSQPTAKGFHDFVQDMVRENSEEATAMAKTLLLENALYGIHV